MTNSFDRILNKHKRLTYAWPRPNCLSLADDLLGLPAADEYLSQRTEKRAKALAIKNHISLFNAYRNVLQGPFSKAPLPRSVAVVGDYRFPEYYSLGYYDADGDLWVWSETGKLTRYIPQIVRLVMNRCKLDNGNT